MKVLSNVLSFPGSGKYLIKTILIASVFACNIAHDGTLPVCLYGVESWPINRIRLSKVIPAGTKATPTLFLDLAKVCLTESK